MDRLTLTLSLISLSACAACAAVSDEAQVVMHEDVGAAGAASPTIAAYDDEPTEVDVTSMALSGTSTLEGALAGSVSTGAAARVLAQPKLYSFKIGGAPFTMIKNWTFGTSGNIRNYGDLSSEFQYHDQFGTIANGANYGAVTVAANSQTAISAPGLGLPNDRQPVDDPARPVREFTPTSMLAHVRPLSRGQVSGSTMRHDVGNGSITSKFVLPKAGKALGRDIVWETRVRMPETMRGYWFALWTAGNRWNRGAEMDVIESFGTQYVKGDAFHSDAVGGTNLINYRDWFRALSYVGLSEPERQLRDWHTWTWIYFANDNYAIYCDGYLVQAGVIHWTLSGVPDGEPLTMSFLFDFSWGHTQVSDVNVELPSSAFNLTYEIAYSRIWIR